MARFSLVCVAAVLSVAVAAHAADAQPFGIEVHGNFKRMSHTGDTAGTVRLAALDSEPALYGVGALAGLAGEIMIWRGRVLVSRGHVRDGAVSARRDDDEATLLVTAKVLNWSEIEVPVDMNQKAFEAFVSDSARSLGLGPTTAFPFAVRGEFPQLTWHVVTGAASRQDSRNSTGISPAQGHAQNRVFDEHRVPGMMLGFYSGDGLEGVITHPGERFHLHYADMEFKRSGHVDRFAVGRGAVLLLPKLTVVRP